MSGFFGQYTSPPSIFLRREDTVPGHGYSSGRQDGSLNHYRRQIGELSH